MNRWSEANPQREAPLERHLPANQSANLTFEDRAVAAKALGKQTVDPHDWMESR